MATRVRWRNPGQNWSMICITSRICPHNWTFKSWQIRRLWSSGVAVADRSSSHWPITLTNGAAALFNLFLPLALVRILSPDEVGRYKAFFLYVMLSPGLFLVSGLTNGLYHWVGKYPEAKAEVRQSWTLLVGI